MTMTPTELNVALAQLGISRRELAEDTGLTVDHISRLRHGKAKASLLLQRYLELRLELQQRRKP